MISGIGPSCVSPVDSFAVVQRGEFAKQSLGVKPSFRQAGALSPCLRLRRNPPFTTMTTKTAAEAPEWLTTSAINGADTTPR
jgi:hypothetical protein